MKSKSPTGKVGRSLIIANGTIPAPKVMRALVAAASIIICADGGANHARRLKIRPNIVLGDFDSLTERTRKALSRAKFIANPAQDSTDLEKALEYCLAHKIRTVDIVGATGSRIDHSTGSLGCFRKYGSRLAIRMIDTIGTLSLIDGETEFTTVPGEKVSLIPLGRCTGIRTSGLFYRLKNESLELGIREGISNEATGTTVRVTVKKGTLLLYRFNQW